MTAAKNPTISKAARKRVHDRVHEFTHRRDEANTAHVRAVTLGDGTARLTIRKVIELEAEQRGYLQALHDILPTKTVEAIAQGLDDDPDESPETDDTESTE